MVSDEENRIIERMIEEGKSAIAIRAAVPNVSRTNVYLKITKFKKHGTVGRVQTKTLGRPRVMGEGVDKFLQGLLAAKPDMELDEMRRHMQHQLHMTVSMSTISRAITRAGMANGRPSRARNSTARRRNQSLMTAPATDGGGNAAVVEQDESTAAARDDDRQHHQTAYISINHRVVSNHNNGDDHVATDDPAAAAWDHLSSSQHLQSGSQHLLPQQAMMHISPLQQQQQQQHQQHHVQQQQQQQNNHDMSALDPLLAHTYPPPSPAYHSIYTPNVTTTANLASASGTDVYRSPYAPV